MNALKKIYNFYIDGFKTMSFTSKKLWLIIFIKLFIMFAILKVFFFKDDLGSRFDNDKNKSEYVIDNLTNN